MPTAQPAVRQDKFSMEKAVFGGVTQITLHGTLNEAFEGRKLAEAIRSKRVVINMQDVRRFASWGMSEWMDFLRECADSDLYLVECSTYVVSQLNIVTGLMGHAKLVSFHASYRCGSCSEEIGKLFLIPAIREIPESTLACATCGGRARLEEFPATFFESIVERPSFDVDDEALAFMRSHLKYDLSPDLTRFRAFRRVQKDYTYLRLTGNIATLPPDVLARAAAGTTLVDLESIVFEPTQVTGWRNFLPAAMLKVKSLQLVNCPPGFLESGVRLEDLRDKLKVRTFGMSYECGTCGTHTVQMVDVASHLEDLVQGAVPPARCSSCNSTLAGAMSPELAAIVSALPARERDVALDSFLAKARAEPIEKLENCLLAPKAKMPPAPRGRGAYLAVGLSVLVVGGLAITMKLRNQPDEPVASGGSGGSSAAVVAPTPHPTFTRPEWIISDVPASASCQDMSNRLMCVGVSSYTLDKDDGVVEATDAALEELVSSIGLKIADPLFKDTLMPAYSDVRAKALSALQAAELDRARDPRAAATYTAAAETVRKARKRVVDVLKASDGAAVPAQRSDWYWEEYTRETGKGTEFLVFVRFDVPTDAVKALVEKYSSTTPVLGGAVMTAFPSLAWEHALFAGGAMVTKPGPQLAGAGIAAQQIVTAVGGQRVTDATGLAKRAEAATDDIKLTVETGDAPGQVVTVPVGVKR